jgi:hypothetical protein
MNRVYAINEHHINLIPEDEYVLHDIESEDEFSCLCKPLVVYKEDFPYVWHRSLLEEYNE